MVIDESEVTDESNFMSDLGADSLDTVELIMEFEKEFDLQIPDDEAEKLQQLVKQLNIYQTAHLNLSLL